MANTRKRSLWDTKIVRRALIDALGKLNPRTMMKNPVMFVVEIGSVITSIYLLRDLLTHHGAAAASICRLRCGFGSRFCSRTSLRRWLKAAAKLRLMHLRRAKSETTAGAISRGRKNRGGPEFGFAGGRCRVRGCGPA